MSEPKRAKKIAILKGASRDAPIVPFAKNTLLALAGDFHQGNNPLVQLVNVFLEFLAHKRLDCQARLVHLIHMLRVLHSLQEDSLNLL